MAGNQGLHSVENGKKGGRPRLEATKLREAIIKEIEQRAEPLAKALVDKALTGDVPALRETFDRGIGKPIQDLDITSDGVALPLLVIERPNGNKEIQSPSVPG